MTSLKIKALISENLSLYHDLIHKTGVGYHHICGGEVAVIKPVKHEDGIASFE